MREELEFFKELFKEFFKESFLLISLAFFLKMSVNVFKGICAKGIIPKFVVHMYRHKERSCFIYTPTATTRPVVPDLL